MCSPLMLYQARLVGQQVQQPGVARPKKAIASQVLQCCKQLQVQSSPPSGERTHSLSPPEMVAWLKMATGTIGICADTSWNNSQMIWVEKSEWLSLAACRCFLLQRQPGGQWPIGQTNSSSCDLASPRVSPASSLPSPLHLCSSCVNEGMGETARGQKK